MDKLHYQDACDRATIAKRKLEILKALSDPSGSREAWGDFLLWSDAFYVGLEKMATGRLSRPWFGKIKHIRRKDPLLQYMDQARNAHQHGVGSTRAIKADSKLRMGAFDIAAVKLGSQEVSKIYLGDDLVYPAVIITLVAVRNYDQVYEVPEIHLDEPISPQYLVFAEAQMRHIETTLRAASVFVDNPKDGS
ncbi:hypothetical protein [Neorhizobium sp. NCHU2750]|uniref:hypothetical protein n=1 Tax=Neorhizobium sp. NCHU2750 TaxID=1825976 RepID=UPI000E756F16